jgi:hypothetical protein
VDAVKPVKVLTNDPTPEPSVVIVPEVVGFDVRPYATPREVTVDPPPNVTSPPSVAELVVIPVALDVVTVGITALPKPKESLIQRTEKP